MVAPLDTSSFQSFWPSSQPQAARSACVAQGIRPGRHTVPQYLGPQGSSADKLTNLVGHIDRLGLLVRQVDFQELKLFVPQLIHHPRYPLAIAYPCPLAKDEGVLPGSLPCGPGEYVQNETVSWAQ